jgi:DNA-binding winged helix-turn-helix (wHTH) protein
VPYSFLDFELDPARFQITRAGEPLPVPRQIFDIILLLIRHRDRPVTKQEILAAIWSDRAVTPASLTHAIAHARRLLGDSRTDQRIIKTVHGRGYWWVAETVDDLPESGRLAPGPTFSALVGREAEVAFLTSTLGAAAHGFSSLTVLTGDPGIGKTRLLEAAAEIAGSQGIRVLRGQCLESDGAPPGWPWIQILRRALLALRETQRGVAREWTDAKSHLTGLFPELVTSGRRGPPSMPPRPDEIFRVFDSLRELLSDLAEVTPLLVTIDDLHRADRFSQALLRLFTRELHDQRIAVLISSRDSEPGPAILGELLQAPRSRVVRLKALSRSHVDALLEASNLPANASVGDMLFNKSGGNPFFLVQLISILRDTPSLLQGDWENPSWLPATLSEAALRQFTALTASASSLLEVAAVVGRAFSAGQIASAANVDPDKAVRDLESAFRLGLIEPDPHQVGMLRFRHILVRDAIYNLLPAAQRCKLHQRVASALRRTASDASALAAIAYHLRAALPLADPEEVGEAGLLAAGDATRRAAHGEAARECESTLESIALSAPVNSLLRTRLLLALATAQMRAGERRLGRESLRRAASIARMADLGPQLAEAALSIAPGLLSIEVGVYDPELVESLEEALRVLNASDSPVRVRLISNLSMALYWSSQRGRARQLVEEAGRMASRLGDPQSRLHVSIAKYVSLAPAEALDERHHLASKIVEFAEAGGDDDARVIARVFRVTSFLEIGDIHAAKREALALERLVSETRHPHGQWYPLMYRATWAITEGDLDAARPLMETFLNSGRRFEDVNASQSFLLQSAEIAWQRGRAAEIIDAVEQNVGRHPFLREWQCALAFLLARGGQPGRARELALDLVRGGLSEMLLRVNGPLGVAALAECAWILRDADLAAHIEAFVEGCRGRVVVAGYGVLCWGSSYRAAGHVAFLLGRMDAAQTAYEAAIAVEKHVGALTWQSRSEMALAEVLAKRGDATEGAASARLVRGARDVGERLGIPDLLG